MNHMQNVNSTMRMMWIYKAGISLLCQCGGEPVSRLFCLCKTSPHLVVGSLGVCLVTVCKVWFREHQSHQLIRGGKCCHGRIVMSPTLTPYSWIPSSIIFLKVLSPVVWTICLTFYKYYSLQLGFPCGSAGKEPACSEGDPGLIPGLGRYLGEGKGYPRQYSALYSPWGWKESDMTEWLSLYSYLTLAIEPTFQTAIKIPSN